MLRCVLIFKAIFLTLLRIDYGFTTSEVGVLREIKRGLGCGESVLRYIDNVSVIVSDTKSIEVIKITLKKYKAVTGIEIKQKLLGL